MFNNFKDKWWCNSLLERIPALNKIKEYTEQKEESIRYAKVFASNISDDIHVLRQFFDITPKVGSYGDVSGVGDITKLGLEPEFMHGYLLEFYISVDGINGFIIKECSDE